jgi:hypothetical protein
MFQKYKCLLSLDAYNQLNHLSTDFIHDQINKLKQTNILIKSEICNILMGEMRKAYKILVGKLEGKRLFGRPSHRWGVNIKMDLKEIGCECVVCIYHAQGRGRWWVLVNAVINLLV